MGAKFLLSPGRPNVSGRPRRRQHFSVRLPWRPQWLRQLAEFRIQTRPVYVYDVGKMAMEHVFPLRVLRFPPVTIMPSTIHTRSSATLYNFSNW